MTTSRTLKSLAWDKKYPKWQKYAKNIKNVQNGKNDQIVK
jgi:hypothetical protein